MWKNVEKVKKKVGADELLFSREVRVAKREGVVLMLLPLKSTRQSGRVKEKHVVTLESQCGVM